MYLVVTLNGKIVQFLADRVVEYDEKYIFYRDDEIVAEFLVKGISGYCFLKAKEDDE